MVKYSTLILVVLLSFPDCFADTFVHRSTGESFNGYVVRTKRGNKTQVRIEKKPSKYLDLRDYTIQRNYLGRKNKVFTFPVKDSINLICETEAFEKAMALSSNQGPLFILIEIDTPGGRIDLARRICAAIAATDNCTTVAFVSGEKFGGAFSAGAIIALACDKIYMRQGTVIGAASAYLRTPAGVQTFEERYGQDIADKFNSAWVAYCSAVAERNNRPTLFVKAMIEKNIEIVEVVENGEHRFIAPNGTELPQNIVRTWSEKGSLLTLTATEAVQSGIADKTTASREELFADLAAAGTAQLRDKNIPRARREFERAWKRMDGLLSSIGRLQEREAALAEELKAIEQEFNRANRVTYYAQYWNVDAVLRDIIIARNRTLAELLNVLDGLIRDYNRAIPLAEKHTDLRRYVEALEDGLKSAQAKSNRFRPVYYR